MHRVVAVFLTGLAGLLQAQTPTFQGHVQPFLARHCYTCHGARLKTANLDLEAYRDETAAAQHPGVWDNVLDKISTGRMPPPSPTPPAKADIAAVSTWIQGLLRRSGHQREQAGRVTARRLNRVEYNNTIRDLLGVPARPADEFPVDDSGYGFDNIGDVLTVSPMLMEKYLAAAERVSRLAVFGEAAPAKPTRLARLLNRRSPDAHDVMIGGSSGGYWPYSLRGAMYGHWVFPVDGEYEFRLRIANFRPASRATQRRINTRGNVTAAEAQAVAEAARTAAPPRKLVLAVDGAPVIQAVVEGDTTFGYERGEFTARVPVKAGERFLRASYPELADLDDPRQNINPDARRQLFVDYLEIVGPFNPSAAPPASYRRVFVCGHGRGQHQASCARTIVSALARRAYRRPVTEAEVEAKLALVTLAQQEGDSFEEGIRLALEAILASPHFLFRAEPPEAGPVSAHDLATRLSYFLWASLPDEELSRAADAGTLRQPAVLAAQVRRLLADPRAVNLVDNFAAQWLQMRSFGRTKPDPARFPTVDDELLDAMRRETSLFVEAVMREDRSVLDFIDAPFTFLNGPLAKHYGVPGVTGEAFQRVTLDGEKRGGLLTQGAILTVSSYPTRTSPPVRGKWVLENLLGAPPPPPPPDVPVLDETKTAANVSMRERLERHRRDPSCAPCHNLMDPIGFGLEGYDAVGAYRTHDGGAAIDTSGTLPDGKSFRGAKDLKGILRGQSEAFTRNLTEKLLTFALGRGLERFDRAAVEQIRRDAEKQDYKFSALVMGIVNSQPFQTRGEGGK
ncbi:MAG: DUF1592 domain-containing protein [Bryobacterales bacterium]|nr:DUF1592 domain-containing protein [Bryobacterales bacterium]